MTGETYPFSETTQHVMFCMFRLEDGEKAPLTEFDRKRKPRMSTIKEYRELSEYWHGVKAGRYVLVPR